MNLEQVKIVYFLGIGGIGMSAIARYFKALGFTVSGYDKTRTELCIALENEGIEIVYDENYELIPELVYQNNGIESLIIYTPAIPKDHKGLVYLRNLGLRIYKRAEILGIISRNYTTIGVAGTHGKTTTSTMLSWILKESGKNTGAFLGGISTNFSSNLLLPTKENPLIVVEADEFDRSFLHLSPDSGIITSTDADHLDIYGDVKSVESSFNEYASKINKRLLVKWGLPINTENLSAEIFYYGLNHKAHYYADKIRIEDSSYVIDIVCPEGVISDVSLGLPGIHNVENAVAATAIAIYYGCELDQIKKALSSFKGVKRRFEYQIKSPKVVYVDDYAHHPTELNSAIQSLRQLYNTKKICGVFQPHLFSRTKDFADGFAQSLDQLDIAIVLDIYPARELPIPGINAEFLLNKMKNPSKFLCSKSNLIEQLNELDFDVLITLGAGDIDTLVNPITNFLKTKYGV